MNVVYQINKTEAFFCSFNNEELPTLHKNLDQFCSHSVSQLILHSISISVLSMRWVFLQKNIEGKWNKAFNHIINWQILPVHYWLNSHCRTTFSCVLPLEGAKYRIYLYSFACLFIQPVEQIELLFFVSLGGIWYIQSHPDLSVHSVATTHMTDLIVCNLYESMSIRLNYQSVKFSHLHLLPSINSLHVELLMTNTFSFSPLTLGKNPKRFFIWKSIFKLFHCRTADRHFTFSIGFYSVNVK